MAYAFSMIPQVNALSIAYNHDLVAMIEQYWEDEDFAAIFNDLAQGKAIEPYSVRVMVSY